MKTETQLATETQIEEAATLLTDLFSYDHELSNADALEIRMLDLKCLDQLTVEDCTRVQELYNKYRFTLN